MAKANPYLAHQAAMLQAKGLKYMEKKYGERTTAKQVVKQTLMFHQYASDEETTGNNRSKTGQGMGQKSKKLEIAQEAANDRFEAIEADKGVEEEWKLIEGVGDGADDEFVIVK